MNCTKRNPAPPCNEGYVEKKTKKGINCCYKDTKSKKVKDTKQENKKYSCTKRNPDPPCDVGFIEKKTKKGILCCYKDTKKNKSNSNKVNIKTKKKKELVPKKNLVCEIKQEKKHFVVSGNDTKNIKDDLKKIGKWIPKFKGWSFKNDDKQKVINLLNDKLFKIITLGGVNQNIENNIDNIPKFYNLLSNKYDYKYNIPLTFKVMYKASEIPGGGEYGLDGYQLPFLTNEILDNGYYTEVRKFIENNNLKIGDILYIGRKTGKIGVSPGDGFVIVTEKYDFKDGTPPLCGVDIVFNPDILEILKENNIKYKECFEKFIVDYPDDWEDFVEGSSSGDDPSFYREEGLWD